jgi:catechol 2,3-dioxygenase-like lactoylglutathione lyase family enzyme
MDHIVLNVRDVERSLDFYVRVLGLRPERVESWRAGQNRFPSVRLNDATIIDLFDASDRPASEPSAENLNHFCMYVDDPLDSCLEELAANGVPIENGPTNRWGARGNAVSVYLRDPDGNQVEIRSYAQVAQPTPAVTASR